MENIMKRYQNMPAAQKRVHGRSPLKEVTKTVSISPNQYFTSVSVFAPLLDIKNQF
jgi:hypothetical protein